MGEMLIVSRRLLHSRHHSTLHVTCTAEVTRAHPLASKDGGRSSQLTDPPSPTLHSVCSILQWWRIREQTEEAREMLSSR